MAETAAALRAGAEEIDMVINVGALRSGDDEAVKLDIAQVVKVAHEAGAIVKVILETALLDDNQKAVACTLVKLAGADFVKTSTGFGPGGRHRARYRADAPGGRSRDGCEGLGRHPHARRFADDGGRRRHPDRRQRQRENRRSHRRVNPELNNHMLTMPQVQISSIRVHSVHSWLISGSETRDASHPKSPCSFSRTLRTAGFPAGSVHGHPQTLDLDQLLANVSEIIKRVIPYELFAILLYSEKRRELRIRYAVGHREEVVNWRFPSRWARASPARPPLRREPVLVGDVRNDPRYLNAVDAVRTELAVPMIARGQAGGRDRRAIHARERLYRIRPRAAAADRGARAPSPSTTRGCTAAWSGRTAR